LLLREWCDEKPEPVRELKEGEVLVRNDFLFVDPYVRGRINGRFVHKAYCATGSVATGVAAALPGTVVSDFSREKARSRAASGSLTRRTRSTSRSS
jgi:NADPH-dependent curcumin reductase CurA